MQAETQPGAITTPENALLGESDESKSKRGGKRAGAGRKPNLAKRLLKGISREAIAEAVATVDVGGIIIGLLKSRRERTRIETLVFVWDRLYGRPAQNVQLSGAKRLWEPHRTPRLWDLGYKNVVEINFGADSPDAKYRNMRAFMWGRLKDWLLTGAIDDTPRLETDLTGPGFELDIKTRILLESKAEMKMNGFDSPDDGDALALTFARKVVARVKSKPSPPPPRIGIWG
jgi:hypothetical protein